MTKRFLKTIICTVAVMCLFCNTFIAFAENGDVDFDFNIQPIEPTTQEEVVETEEPTEEPTQAPTKKPTEAPTEKPTKKPTKPQEAPQERPQNNQNNQANDNQPATQATTEEELAEGTFFVYLEKNNGEKRLKTLVEKGGLLPKPSDPTRKGYIFDGWYSDSKFKNEWDFEKDKAKKEMTIYAKWIADESTVEFDIVIEDIVGGKLETNPTKASKGEPVFITVIPDEGKRLVAGSLIVNGKPTDVFSFIMPKGKVTISASFEDVPETVDDGEEEEKNLTPFIIIGVIILIAIIAGVVVIVMRRRDFNADLDPDEEYEEDSADETLWIDESIVVEDGFKEGKKVVENAEPDYGATELDTDDFE